MISGKARHIEGILRGYVFGAVAAVPRGGTGKGPIHRRDTSKRDGMGVWCVEQYLIPSCELQMQQGGCSCSSSLAGLLSWAGCCCPQAALLGLLAP